MKKREEKEREERARMQAAAGSGPSNQRDAPANVITYESDGGYETDGNLCPRFSAADTGRRTTAEASELARGIKPGPRAKSTRPRERDVRTEEEQAVEKEEKVEAETSRCEED